MGATTFFVHLEGRGGEAYLLATGGRWVLCAWTHLRTRDVPIPHPLHDKFIHLYVILHHNLLESFHVHAKDRVLFHVEGFLRLGRVEEVADDFVVDFEVAVGEKRAGGRA